MDIEVLSKLLSIVRRTSGESAFLTAVHKDIEELIVKITTQLALHYDEHPDPDMITEFTNIAKSDAEYNEFIRDSLPILFLLHSVHAQMM